MRGLVAVDFQGKGQKHVVTATEEGLLTAFQADGKQSWVTYLPSAPRSLCTVPRATGDLLAAGCDSGMLLLIDAAGRPVAQAQLKGAVRQLHAVRPDGEPALIAGTTTGAVVLLKP
jgi:hypothetical protein